MQCCFCKCKQFKPLKIKTNDKKEVSIACNWKCCKCNGEMYTLVGAHLADSNVISEKRAVASMLYGRLQADYYEGQSNVEDPYRKIERLE